MTHNPPRPSDGWDSTRELLERCSSGDREARIALIERDKDWIREYVRRRCRGLPAAYVDDDDLFQEVLIEVFESSGSFVVDSQGQFRRIMACIVRNTMRSLAAHHHAQKRDVRRVRWRASDTILYLGEGRPARLLHRSATSPSRHAARAEETEIASHAMGFLIPEDRLCLQLRRIDGESYAVVAEALGTTPDAARMRAQRALVRLTEIVAALQSGRVEMLIAHLESEPAD